MDPFLYISFLIASVLLILIPGPNVLVVVSTSITHGAMRGLQTVLGTSAAMVIQLIIAALGTTWLVASITTGFEWLRWFGVAYLLYLGVKHLLNIRDSEKVHEVQITAKDTFARGFIVSLTNPKTILFFGAFLPQFVSSDDNYVGQLTILSISFLLLAIMLDNLYAVMAGRIRHIIQSPGTEKIKNGVAGLLYVGAGTWLAAMKRS